LLDQAARNGTYALGHALQIVRSLTMVVEMILSDDRERESVPCSARVSERVEDG
jgi:hypothetical protein